MSTIRKSRKIRPSKKQYVSPITQEQEEERKKYEEFWSDPCWQEPLNAQG